MKIMSSKKLCLAVSTYIQQKTLFPRRILAYSDFLWQTSATKAINYFTKAQEVIMSAKGYESIKFNIMYQILRTRLDLG